MRFSFFSSISFTWHDVASAKLQKTFCTLGLLVAFLVADKSPQVHPTTNLETVKTNNSPHLIHDFPITLKH